LPSLAPVQPSDAPAGGSTRPTGGGRNAETAVSWLSQSNVERPVRMAELAYAGLSDPGLQRSHNEDRWLADPSLGLFLVVDGVGGAGGGALAAQIVVDELLPLIRRHLRGVRSLADERVGERLHQAVAAVNASICIEGSKVRKLRRMGAVIVLALVWDDLARIVHVGDSRAYLFHDNELHRLTCDHTVVQRLIEQGKLAPEEANGHPDASLLTRYLGLREEVEAATSVVELAPEDRLLLCSDGLSAMLSDDEIRGILSLPLGAKETANLLIDTANLMGGVDNTTVVLVQPGDSARKSRRPGSYGVRH
jgi:protein phosphatase